MSELSPHMTPNEINLLVSFYQCANCYAEFGSGGSTFLAAKTVKERVLTVDSDREWLEKVKTSCYSSRTPLDPEIHFVNIGPTGDWGYPVDVDKREDWPLYHEKIWSASDFHRADLYMVDGRFRVACFAQILLHAAADAIILVHDYASRSHYHVVEPFVKELCRSDDLSAFQAKPRFDRIDVAALLSQHKFDTR